MVNEPFGLMSRSASEASNHVGGASGTTGRNRVVTGLPEPIGVRSWPVRTVGADSSSSNQGHRPADGTMSGRIPASLARQERKRFARRERRWPLPVAARSRKPDTVSPAARLAASSRAFWAGSTRRCRGSALPEVTRTVRALCTRLGA